MGRAPSGAGRGRAASIERMLASLVTRASSPLSTLALALATALCVASTAACGGSVVAAGGAGAGGAGAGGAGAAGPGDPCAGLACGSLCSACPGGDAPCYTGSCDEVGVCVPTMVVACGSGCPATLPDEAAACEVPGLVCEYGDGPIVACRERAVCTEQGFTLLLPNCLDEHVDPEGCPAAAPAVGDPCEVDVDPSLCEYPPAFCGCSNCGFGGPCGGPGEWACAAPAEGCPSVAPRLGFSCASEGQSCQYGSCVLGGVYAGRTCLSGNWVDSTGPCPL